jgi:CRISPR-associated protein Csm1
LTATVREAALGGFLHDTGKFLQRASSSEAEMSAAARNLESEILPLAQGRYTHRHALWTEEFFERIRPAGLPQPFRFDVVRRFAVYHHAPDRNGAEGWIIAEADRLASGMDRKPKDESGEGEVDTAHGRDRYIKTALLSPFAGVSLDPGHGFHKGLEPRMPLSELGPGRQSFPSPQVDVAQFPAAYKRLWERFIAAFRQALQTENPALLEEAVQAAGARFLTCIPSSTVDQPDISLFDHSKAVAAVAAALYRYHEKSGSLDDEAAIKDRNRRKFRCIAGDLSGIQDALFLLQNQGVKGINRILRARSFLIGMVVEAAALECLRALDLPRFSLVQQAGGRFLILAADEPELEPAIGAVRERVERWLYERYTGELCLNLAVTPAFCGNDLLMNPPVPSGGFAALQRQLGAAVEEAKLRAFSTVLGNPVHRSGSASAERCSACAVRAATRNDGRDGEPQWRCTACSEEHLVGSALPKLRYLGWHVGKHGNSQGIRVFDDLWLCWPEVPDARGGWISLSEVANGSDEEAPLARYFANYVPRFSEKDEQDPRYRRLSGDAQEPRQGELKTFEHLAADAREEKNGARCGEPFLMVLKADVDRLGQIFQRGFGKDMSLSRLTSVSRMMDFFFTAQLPDLLRKEFPSTYTVYAGGDDLLLIGPWRQMIGLATRLQEEFAWWTGNNKSITISAGLELFKVNQPLNRVVSAAERRLEAAKNYKENHKEGRNQVCAIAGEPVTWQVFRELQETANDLFEELVAGTVSARLAYRLLQFIEMRQLSEARTITAGGEGGSRSAQEVRAISLAASNWRARWGYLLRRHYPKLEEHMKSVRLLNRLLGLGDDLRHTEWSAASKAAVAMGLYRYRNSENL